MYVKLNNYNSSVQNYTNNIILKLVCIWLLNTNGMKTVFNDRQTHYKYHPKTIISLR